MGQNALVCVACVIVCVSLGRLWECDWVFGLDRWDIEGVVCVVGVGHVLLVWVLGCGVASLSCSGDISAS